MLRKKRLKCGRIPARLFLPVIKNPILLSASSFAAQNRCVLTFLWATPRDPGNATPQYIARGSQLVARHIRAQTRRSLNECALVRLASQAVQPSQNIVAYRPWSGRYAPCFSPTSPRFIRHRRRFGDVARLSPLAYQTLRCGYGKHDYRSQLITFFYIAAVRVIDKSQFIKPKYSTLLYTCSNINKADLRTPH